MSLGAAGPATIIPPPRPDRSAGQRGAIFRVTTLRDAGQGSLRQAILDANANPGADTILFDLPGRVERRAIPPADHVEELRIADPPRVEEPPQIRLHARRDRRLRVPRGLDRLRDPRGDAQVARLAGPVRTRLPW